MGKCPRRIGLVSQGLVVRGMSEAINQLLSRNYSCVIVDESHRARRRKVPKVDAKAEEIDEKAEPMLAGLKKCGFLVFECAHLLLEGVAPFGAPWLRA